MAGRKAFLLRMDPALWREIEAWAQQAMRSVNGQVEFLLRQAVNRRKAARDAEPGAGAAGDDPPAGST